VTERLRAIAQPPSHGKPNRSLLVRLYAFTAALSLALMVALLVLPRYARSARYLEPHAALVQFMIERWSTKSPQAFKEAFTRLEPRLRGKFSVYAVDGRLLESSIDPPTDPPTESERDELTNEKWALSYGRFVVRSDDGSMIGVYEPNRQSFPWEFVLPLGAGVLLVVGAASLWFTRSLARPLGRLAAAARAFGSGDTAARADLQRGDELGSVGKAFDDMADRTAALLVSQRQLMADVSHELRTPLARIRVALELAAEDPGAAKDVLADVGIDLDEIDQLIEDILTTARLDLGSARSPKLHHEPTRIGDLVDRAYDRFKAKHPGRTLERPAVDGAPLDVVELDVDAVLFRRALDNLLDNAAKYSDAGQPVRLIVRRDSDHVSFDVIDRGIGMSVDELEHAFEPFWRADGSRTRRTGGVGLGLALARRIARAHGGDVTLVSATGRGTTATLSMSAS
jgi:two-component system OmpR family sensor kinase